MKIVSLWSCTFLQSYYGELVLTVEGRTRNGNIDSTFRNAVASTLKGLLRACGVLPVCVSSTCILKRVRVNFMS